MPICFFGSILYKIKEQKIQDDYVIFLAKLGGGKGIVSGYYMLEGIHMIMAKYRVHRILKEEKASEEATRKMLAMGCFDLD